ncbi:MAG: hypothetical protein BWY22_02287 [Bacteroidetes bacterium ADurb.Bin217]|nr:MAG: hypothetical protein BWY22_02287 [Bacteroidetes bacterium ADurb.Bin217]
MISMIKQVSSTTWKNIIKSKGSQAEQDAFLNEVKTYQHNWMIRKQSLSAKYKGDLENPEYIKAKKLLQKEVEQILLAYGFYEEV